CCTRERKNWVPVTETVPWMIAQRSSSERFDRAASTFCTGDFINRSDLATTALHTIAFLANQTPKAFKSHSVGLTAEARGKEHGQPCPCGPQTQGSADK